MVSTYFFKDRSTVTPTIKVYNNTFYEGSAGNHTNGTGGNFGDINIQSTTATLPWKIAVDQKLRKSQTPHSTRAAMCTR